MTATDTNTVNDTKLTCVAAVQMEGRVADVPYNIDHAARLIELESLGATRAPDARNPTP